MTHRHSSQAGPKSSDIRDTAGFFERILEWFAFGQTAGVSGITDEATLRELSRLDEWRLKDIGVCRKLRRTRRDYFARGLPGFQVDEFDYFRLDK